MGHFEKGTKLRLEIKNLVYDFMLKCDDCSNDALGTKQAEIFRACGLDWGEYPNATSSNQQYWLVGLLRDLEKDGKIQRDSVSKHWRLK